MSKTITVKGTGRISAKPDYVVIAMSLDSRDKEYDKAMEFASDNVQSLKDSLAKAGFAEETVKTTNFNVRADYSNVS